MLKLQQALAYLILDPTAPYKKRNNFKGMNTYSQNRNYVRSLQDTEFIPFDGADADIFLDVVDDNYSVFTPEIINHVDDEEHSEEWHINNQSPISLSSTPKNDVDVTLDESGEDRDDCPTLLCMQDMLNDNDMAKYTYISGIDIINCRQ